jgi:hypothetical protein
VKRFILLTAVLFAVCAPALASAATKVPALPPAPVDAASGKPKPYDDFVNGATVVPGLIPLVRKQGDVYFVLSKEALGRDFIETSVPQSGLGGFGPAAGEPYVAPARILRFERQDNRVVLRWPNTIAIAKPNTPEQAGVTQSLPASVISVEPIVAENAANGDIVISASAFLGDVADYAAVFSGEIKDPSHGYRLDPTRTYFTDAKGFPQNDVLRVSQTWASGDPNMIDVAPDARSLEVDMAYNLVAAPDDNYMPRIADPRVGYFEQPLLDFSHDNVGIKRNVYYLSRWNFAPKTPGQPSVATHQLVFTLSDDVPVEYRDSVRKALLSWNSALAAVGILNAIDVRDQPTDPDFDPDDMRNNMVRWVDSAQPQYGAEALIVTDPRTGEEVNVGINVDAVEGLAGTAYRFLIAPARGLPNDPKARDAFVQEEVLATVLHESGHDLGLQHNFIGSMAYTAKELQSKAFTQKYGVATSVMEYAPINLWPKGTPQGDYEQQVLGPYDYYAIRYGYGYIPGANTPSAELPTLNTWASRWEDPMYRFASDEDVDFSGGHAIDPRVQQDDLTDKPLAWCDVQMKMTRGLMNAVDARFPSPGEPWDVARAAFGRPLRAYESCALMAAHTIGGEYLSRAQLGDPNSTAPLSPVSRADEIHAWHQLDSGLFSDAAWHFNPNVLNRLTYSEVSSFGGGTWAYDPSPHHDLSIAQIAAQLQDRAMSEMYAPLTLDRLDSYALKYPAGATMSLEDLFDWSRASIFGNLRDGSIAKAGVVRRNLQMRYAQLLSSLWLSPDPGTPSDARALARLALVHLADDAQAGQKNPHLTQIARAQLGALGAVASQALNARASVSP